MDEPTVRAARRVIEAALAEDIGSEGDLTTLATIPEGVAARAELIAREEGILCGLPVAQMTFAAVDPEIRFEARLKEGERLHAGTVIAAVEGSARSIFAAERTALNFLQHLSFIATITSKAVSLANGRAQILDTRKTTPGLCLLEKYAVRTGGGHNHRKNLSEAVLVKDNHIAVSGGISRAVKSVRDKFGDRLVVEVEAETLEQVRQALAAGAEIIMLDNMDAASMAEAVELIGRQAIVEASGGIGLEHVEEIAASGVDRISMGCLTAGGRLDISLETTT